MLWFYPSKRTHTVSYTNKFVDIVVIRNLGSRSAKLDRRVRQMPTTCWSTLHASESKLLSHVHMAFVFIRMYRRRSDDMIHIYIHICTYVMIECYSFVCTNDIYPRKCHRKLVNSTRVRIFFLYDMGHGAWELKVRIVGISNEILLAVNRIVNFICHRSHSIVITCLISILFRSIENGCIQSSDRSNLRSSREHFCRHAR